MKKQNGTRKNARETRDAFHRESRSNFAISISFVRATSARSHSADIGGRKTETDNTRRALKSERRIREPLCCVRESGRPSTTGDLKGPVTEQFHSRLNRTRTATSLTRVDTVQHVFTVHRHRDGSIRVEFTCMSHVNASSTDLKASKKRSGKLTGCTQDTHRRYSYSWHSADARNSRDT